MERETVTFVAGITVVSGGGDEVSEATGWRILGRREVKRERES